MLIPISSATFAMKPTNVSLTFPYAFSVRDVIPWAKMLLLRLSSAFRIRSRCLPYRYPKDPLIWQAAHRYRLSEDQGLSPETITVFLLKRRAAPSWFHFPCLLPVGLLYQDLGEKLGQAIDSGEALSS